jgi:hypothetical protein
VRNQHGKKASKQPSHKTVATLTHEEARRKNIPTAEYQSVMQKEAESPVRVAYERRNRDLNPQLAWRRKDEQDWSDLVVHAPWIIPRGDVQSTGRAAGSPQAHTVRLCCG